MDEDLDDLITQKATTREFNTLATSKGFLRLIDDAIGRVKSGETTLLASSGSIY